MNCGGYLFGNFRENESPHKIVHKFIKNNNNEIKRNHLSCIFNSLDKQLIKLRFSFFIKLNNFNNNFIIIDDLKMSN